MASVGSSLHRVSRSSCCVAKDKLHNHFDNQSPSKRAWFQTETAEFEMKPEGSLSNPRHIASDGKRLAHLTHRRSAPSHAVAGWSQICLCLFHLLRFGNGIGPSHRTSNDQAIHDSTALHWQPTRILSRSTCGLGEDLATTAKHTSHKAVGFSGPSSRAPQCFISSKAGLEAAKHPASSMAGHLSQPSWRPWPRSMISRP